MRIRNPGKDYAEMFFLLLQEWNQYWNDYFQILTRKRLRNWQDLGRQQLQSMVLQIREDLFRIRIRGSSRSGSGSQKTETYLNL